MKVKSLAKLLILIEFFAFKVFANEEKCEEILINDEIQDLTFFIRPCLKVLSKGLNENLMGKVEANKSPLKSLWLLQTNNSLNFAAIEKRLFNFDLYIKAKNGTTWVKCVYSERFKALKAEDDCEKRPFWSERKVRASFVIGRDMKPDWLRFATIAHKIGFDFEKVPCKGFGPFVASIAKKKADVAAMKITMSHKRHKVIATSAVNEMTDVHWVYTYPKPRRDSFTKLIDVFHVSTWFGMLTVWFIVAIASTFILRSTDDRDPLFRGLTISYTGVINEPIDWTWMKIDYTSQFMFFMFWLPLAFFINMAYKANLLVNVIAIDYENTIDTSQQVLDSGLPVHIYKTGMFFNIFNNNPTPLLKKIYEKNVLEKGGTYVAKPGQRVPPEIVAMRKAGEAIWMDATYIMVGKLQDWRISDEIVFRGLTTEPIAFHSPLRELYTILLLKYKEGRIDHYPLGNFRGWPRLDKRTLPKLPDKLEPLVLEHTWSSLGVLALGLALAIVAFALEIVLNMCTVRVKI